MKTFIISIFECGRSWSGQANDYEIGICCFSAEHTELRSKSKNLESLESE